MERRVLAINPNSDHACSERIREALQPFGRPGAVRFDTVTLSDGPPAIATWADWYSVVPSLGRTVRDDRADAYVIACVSDPGIDAIREATDRPVFGPFRCAVAAALARADRFGVIAFVEASKPRQRKVLQSMGVEARLAATEALNLPMSTLTSSGGALPALTVAGRRLVDTGAEVVVLGCAGMAHHRAALEIAVGRPVIEPIAAAACAALLALT